MHNELLRQGSSISVVDESASQDDVSLGSLGSNDPLDSTGLDTNLARLENKAVSRLRGAVVSVLVVAAVCVSTAVYVNTSHAQESLFRSAFQDSSRRVMKSFTGQMSRRLGAMDALAVDASSYARTLNVSWPGVTMHDFTTRASSAQNLADAASVLWLPIVTNETRSYWEAYSVEHSSWIDDDNKGVRMNCLEDDMFFQRSRVALEQQQLPTACATIPPHIFDAQGISHGSGPFAPIWQTAPIPDDVATWINFDTLSHEGLQGGLRALLKSRLAVVGEVVEFPQSHPLLSSLLKKQQNESDGDDGDQPFSTIFYPVFDKSSNNDDSKVVAVLAFVSSWKFYFTEVLGPGVSGLMAVVTNECGQAFTFEINGDKAKYLGHGDKHHAWFDSMHESEGFIPNNSDDSSSPAAMVEGKPHHSVDLNTDYCTYTLHVYPSKKMRDDYVTNQPILYAVLVSLIFVFATILFASYDCLVERRQQVVMDHAIQSTAIVSSLFPQQVRDRLFRRSSLGGADMENTDDCDGSYVTSFEPVHNRLKSFLDKSNEGGPHQNHNANEPAKPIADLFSNCTVLFADIAGFTAWSSIRDPAQVFTLLESVYQSFDKIARKRGVFKVETIGDSYVAVTGLPDAQEDHAIIMVRFARDCRSKMDEVTSNLVLTLGPDTCDLKMRFGLHSGPVTAGVLRGEKSRFQLFGDTVNTAARMESTGEKDRIQMSQTTADCLRNAGKGHWIKAREDLVHAKGKGELQTYWFEPTNSRRSISSVCSEDSSSTRASIKSVIWGAQDEAVPPDRKLERNKHLRLVNYNVDLLAQLLKQVVARRQMLELAGLWSPDEGPPEYCEYCGEGPTVIDEVAEVIKLPKFDPRAFAKYVDPETIDFEPDVMAQLKRFVTIIGAMYRSNPFHNFEHASHVTMSVNKLLQRVVAPEVRVRRRSLASNVEGITRQMASDLHNYTHGITSDPLTQFAVVFSALIHDVDHWGVSNAQLVKEGVPIAEKYKNKTVAEQNSVDLAFDLLMNPDDYPDLQKCIFPTKSEYQRFRQVVVNNVMATDIFDPELAELSRQRWTKAFEECSDSDPDAENRKATVVIEHIMQASDVAHSMQHWHVYQKWNRRLFDELYTAYKAGRMGVDPTNFWVEGEKKFFDNHIIPLATKLQQCGVFGVASDECLNYAMNNRREWCVQGQMIVDELVDNYNKREQEEKLKKEQAEANGNRNGKNRQRFARRRSLFTTAG